MVNHLVRFGDGVRRASGPAGGAAILAILKGGVGVAVAVAHAPVLPLIAVGAVVAYGVHEATKDDK